MQITNDSYDADFHKFFAAHYATHWFNPWNEKWFTGFSQTTYPPMEQQWMALFSHVMGLNLAYIFVQLIAILLLPLGVYKYARIWVGERAASYAAAAVCCWAHWLHWCMTRTAVHHLGRAALPDGAGVFLRMGARRRLLALCKALALTMAAASAHHVTLLFASVIFTIPVVVTAIMDRKREGNDATVAGVVIRQSIFAGLSPLADSRGAAARLAGLKSEPHQADADPARQPRELLLSRAG